MKIPTRIIGYGNKTPEKRKGGFRFIFQKAISWALALILVLTNSQIFNAYEAHTINVTANICDYSQILSMGYWKNRPEVYLPLLPQFLGAPGRDEEISTQDEIIDNQTIFDYATTSVAGNSQVELVVYRNGDTDFALNNVGGDAVSGYITGKLAAART